MGKKIRHSLVNYPLIEPVLKVNILPGPLYIYIEFESPEILSTETLRIKAYDKNKEIANIGLSSASSGIFIENLEQSTTYTLKWTYTVQKKCNLHRFPNLFSYTNTFCLNIRCKCNLENKEYSEEISTTSLNNLHLKFNPPIPKNTVMEEEFSERIKYVKNLLLPDHSFHQFLNILLIGNIGSGKSSFINTIASCLFGSYIHNSLTGNQSSSFTKNVSYRKITDDMGVELCPKINIVDMFGLESDPGKYGILAKKLIEGKVKPGMSLDSYNELSIQNDFIDYTENLGKRTINGAIIIIAQQTIDSEEQMRNLEAVADILKKMEIPYNIALTQVDTIHVQKKPFTMQKVYSYPEIYDKINQITTSYPGIGTENQIFPVMNYRGEYGQNSDKYLEYMAMHAFFSIVRAGRQKIAHEMVKNDFN